MIIKVIKREYTEGNLAVSYCRVTFLWIPVFTKKITTTSINVRKQLDDSLSAKPKQVNILGFTYKNQSQNETENKD